MNQNRQQYLEIAKIVNTHGIKGDVKLQLWCDSPDIMKKIKTLYLSQDGSQPVKISGARMHGSFMLLHIAGIETPEEATHYKNHILYADRDDVPKEKDACFIADLIGTPVIDADTNNVLGVLEDVLENPANALYVVRTPTGETVLLPAVPAFILRLDPPEGIYVRPIPGFFPETAKVAPSHNTAAPAGDHDEI